MPKPKLHIHFPSLPQRSYECRHGLSTLIYDDKKRAVLVDGGEGEFFDQMENYLRKNLTGEDEYAHVTFVLTHWHGDHYCGLRNALNSPHIFVDEIYCPDPAELKSIPKDDGYAEYNAAQKVLNLARELNKKIIYPAPGKKVGHWVGDIRMWMWRQKANPGDYVNYQLNNTSIQIYFPDLQHLETGDAITSSDRFLKAYDWPMTSVNLNHHGNGSNSVTCELYEQHGVKICWYSDWEPKGVSIGGTNFSKYGAGKAVQRFRTLRPFEDVDVTADGEGHVIWKQGSNTYTYDIPYGASPKPTPEPEPTPAPSPELRDMSELFGVDVSYAQGVIDWNKAAGEIDFAILQAGYGQDRTDQDDRQFARNCAECERLGIPYGIYLYSYAGNTTRATGEADHVLRLANGKQMSLPIYYDLEESSLANAAAGNMVVFGTKVENAGYHCGVYSGEYYYNRNLSNVTRYTKWIARYGSNSGHPGTKPNVQNVTIWQYSSKGRVPGINGNVDVNIMYGDDLLKAVTGKDYIQAAKDVWAGKYGAGTVRESALRGMGFDPRIVQHFVNRLVVK